MYYGASSGAPTYQITVAAAENPVTLTELKAWLKISGSSEDTLLTAIIVAVTRNAELYTKRDFISKTYRTYRDYFGEADAAGVYPRMFGYGNQNQLELRRTPLNAITSVKYYNTSNVLTTISSAAYYTTVTDGSTYSMLYPSPDNSWPSDINTQRLQAVEIIFTAGYANAATFKAACPDLWQALFAHMAAVYVNRGDCSMESGCGCDKAPPEARMVYGMYRIIDFASAC